MYAFSDIHGNYTLWKKIEKFLKDNNEKAIFLGDAVDRGPDGWKIFKELIDSPYINNYIMGNHELMMIEDDVELWLWNGGASTQAAMLKDPEKDKYIQKFKNIVSYHVIHNNWFISHAGMTIPEDFLNYKLDNDSLVWDRDHIYNSFGNEKIQVLHGHTPVQFIRHRFDMLKIPYDFDDEQGVLVYSNGRKYCIDLCTYETNAITLFNLETKEGIVFRDETR